MNRNIYIEVDRKKEKICKRLKNVFYKESNLIIGTLAAVSTLLFLCC